LTVYGRNSVEEAIEEGLTIQLIYMDSHKRDKFQKILSVAKQKDIRVTYKNDKELENLSRTRKHQGIVADIEMPANIRDLEGEAYDWTEFNRFLALDGITDTGNLGALIRSSLLFNIDAVVLPRDASARITPAVIKASAGAVYKQNIFYIDNLNYFIDEIKDDGAAVYGLAGAVQYTSIKELEIPRRCCVVIGSERKGMRKSVRKKCSSLIKIPTTGRLDSLNASVAGAIAMWELFRADID
jgi:23S rRNA (guanosine2251-2'-O)-methyltransferase